MLGDRCLSHGHWRMGHARTRFRPQVACRFHVGHEHQAQGQGMRVRRRSAAPHAACVYDTRILHQGSISGRAGCVQGHARETPTHHKQSDRLSAGPYCLLAISTQSSSAGVTHSICCSACTSRSLCALIRVLLIHHTQRVLHHTSSIGSCTAGYCQLPT
jgi:hypothetical protein